MPVPTIVGDTEYLTQTEARTLLGRGGRPMDIKTFQKASQGITALKNPTDARVWLYRKADIVALLTPRPATQEEIDQRKRGHSA